MNSNDLLHPIHVALHEFEEAVKKHEHRSLTESEVVRRQEVDRAREIVMAKIRELLERT